MMSFMTNKIDKMTIKVDSSFIVPKKAQEEAVAARQAADEANTNTSAVEQEISDIKADLNKLRSHGLQEGIKKKEMQDIINPSINKAFLETVQGRN